jgi:hypothetical protein
MRFNPAASASDLEVDEKGNVYVAITAIRVGSRRKTRDVVHVLHPDGTSSSFAPVSLQLTERQPFYRAPIVNSYIALAGDGRLALTHDVAYQLEWYERAGQLVQTVSGCSGTIDNKADLVRGYGKEGFKYRRMTHDIAFNRFGVLHHLTPSVDQGYQLMERYSPTGFRLPPVLLPGRGVPGGIYLSAVLPTSEPNLFWGYQHVTGDMVLIELHL